MHSMSSGAAMPVSRASSHDADADGSEVPLHADRDLVVARLATRRGGGRGQRLLTLREDLEMLAGAGDRVDDLHAADDLRHGLRLEAHLALRLRGAAGVDERPVEAADGLSERLHLKGAF